MALFKFCADVILLPENDSYDIEFFRDRRVFYSMFFDFGPKDYPTHFFILWDFDPDLPPVKLPVYPLHHFPTRVFLGFHN